MQHIVIHKFCASLHFYYISYSLVLLHISIKKSTSLLNVKNMWEILSRGLSGNYNLVLLPVLLSFTTGTK